MRRFLKFTALISVLCALFIAQAAAATPNVLYNFGGKGTQSDPFIIDSAADLEQLAANVSSGIHYSGATFKLMTDISVNTGRWEAIGTSSKPFSGKFDGNNHKVTGISIIGTNAGLFGSLKNATVSNLYVSVGSVSATFQSETYSGAIAGIADNSTITNCFVSGTSAITVTGTAYIGGIVGKMNGGQINNCVSSPSLNISIGMSNNVNLYAGSIGTGKAGRGHR